MKTPQAKLEDLLLELHTPEELSRWLRRRYGRGALNDLADPGKTKAATWVHEAVDLLDRRGKLPEIIEAMAQQHGHRAEELRGVAEELAELGRGRQDEDEQAGGGAESGAPGAAASPGPAEGRGPGAGDAAGVGGVAGTEQPTDAETPRPAEPAGPRRWPLVAALAAGAVVLAGAYLASRIEGPPPLPPVPEATLDLAVVMPDPGRAQPEGCEGDTRLCLLAEALSVVLARGPRAVLIDRAFEEGQDVRALGPALDAKGGVPVLALRPLNGVSALPVCAPGAEFGCVDMLLRVADPLLEQPAGQPLTLCAGGGSEPTASLALAALALDPEALADGRRGLSGLCVSGERSLRALPEEPCGGVMTRAYVSELRAGQPIEGEDPLTLLPRVACPGALELEGRVVLLSDPWEGGQEREQVALELGRGQRKTWMPQAEAKALLAWNVLGWLEEEER
ncbi:MAG: hypothetical protein H6739_35415 [Alphaproteobacteria bacterium]|nr:hypothetical protein [Alphaproteobacteria bacterium]